jgi:hypothetical protein
MKPERTASGKYGRISPPNRDRGAAAIEEIPLLSHAWHLGGNRCVVANQLEQ